MAKQFNAKLASGSSEGSLPSAYQIMQFDITTNGGDVINIIDLIGTINISESLYRSSIQLNATIQDGLNFLEIKKLTGNEKINVHLKTVELTDDNSGEKKEFKLELYLASIQNYSKASPGVQYYELVAVSKHSWINQLKVLERSFQGSIGQLIQSICKKDLEIKPNFINTDTKDIIKGIYPKLRPLNAVSWLLRNAFDNSTPFYFYETATNGVNFNSYDNLIEEDTYREYKQKAFYTGEMDSKDAYEEGMAKIRKISSELNLSKYLSASSGAYASNMISFDIATKKLEKNDFKYEGKKLKKLNKNLPFSLQTEFQSKKLNEFTKAKNHFICTNSLAFGNLSNYHQPLVPTLLKNEAYLENTEFMTHDIELNGDFDLCVGKKINLTLSKSSDPDELDDERSNMVDKLLSGLHIITTITHKFEEEYTMDVRCKKDSLVLELD